MRILRCLSLLLTVLFGAALARGEELQVTAGGLVREPLTAFASAGHLYLNAKQAGELYGARVTWYPVSGRVQMSFRGAALQFVVGSAAVAVGGRTVSLEAPVMLRAAQAYVPLSFFLGHDFTDLSGMESQFDERARSLAVDRHSSVGAVRWFSYQDYTRVVLELKRPLGHTVAARGAQGVEVSVPFGVIEAPETASVNDGLVTAVALRQDAKAARWSVKFARPGLKWRLRELSAPRRLALEVAAVAPEHIIPGPVNDSAAPGEAASAAPAPVPASPSGNANSVLAGTAAPLPPPVAAVVSTAVVPPAAKPAASSVQAASTVSPAAAPMAEPMRRRIVIDAGHGGKDSGATGRRGIREKDINLAVAQELAKLLQEEKAFEVLLTRSDDTFVPLADRSRIANEAHADLFVSLHCNAHRSARENGFEVYFLSEKASDPEAARLAQFENSSLTLEGKSPADEEAAVILQAMSKTENINAASELAALVARALHQRVDLAPRGVKQAAFYVLRGTDAPAILLEMAFVSNGRDAAKLGTKRFRRRLVDAVYAGLLDYAKRQGWLGKPSRT